MHHMRAPPCSCRYLVCMDTSCNVFVLALVRMAHDAFNTTQLLAVTHPEVMHVDVKCKGQVSRALTPHQGNMDSPMLLLEALQ